VASPTATETTEIEPRREARSEIATYDAPAASELEQWARDLSQAYYIAERLVTTSFVPRSYAGKPQEAAAAMMTGAEIGLSPIASLRSIDIIDGVPAMRAIAMRALVQSKGHEIWVVESTATRAVVRGRRRGEDQVQESVWTVERAKQLGLLGKQNWVKQPIAMLLARATSELARLIAADVLLGIPYSIEELEDMVEGTGDAPAKPRASSKVQRKPLVARPTSEPDLPETPVPATDGAPTEEPPIVDDEPPAGEPEPVESPGRPAVLEELPVDMEEPSDGE
jgi:hypothetical protein